MKKILTLLFTTFVVINAINAQEIDVNSFILKDSYELKGDEVKKDGNGYNCAMIIVYFQDSGMSFENSYLMSTSTVGTSYKVFMAPGASRLTIKHNDYLPKTITFEDYGIKRLQSNKAYTINLVADNTSNALDKQIAESWEETQPNPNDPEYQYTQAKIYYMGFDGEPDYDMSFDLFSKSAAQGNVNAIYHLGLSYFYGQGTVSNQSKAISYFKSAAEKGHAMAQFKYANCLNPMIPEITGRKSIKDAISWYEKAAANGLMAAKNNLSVIYLQYDPTNFGAGTSDVKKFGFPEYYSKGLRYLRECESEGFAEAYLNLANIYLDGIGVSKDESKAIEYLNKGVANGYYECYNTLGSCYMHGLGVTSNMTKAFEYFKLAAEKGNPKGNYNLALCYQLGYGTSVNYFNAAKYYQKAADQRIAVAETNLGNMYEWGQGVTKNLAKAFELYENAAQDGDPSGYTNMGRMYHEGLYVAKDINKAVIYYTKAADLGNYGGIINLAMLYQTGAGVPLDAYKAVELYERAVKIDHTGAAYYNYGCVYYFGCGKIRKDYKKAYELFMKSADMNFSHAQYNIGVMYLNGEYVSASRSKGTEYVKKAAAQGHEAAKDLLKRL